MEDHRLRKEVGQQPRKKESERRDSTFFEQVKRKN